MSEVRDLNIYYNEKGSMEAIETNVGGEMQRFIVTNQIDCKSHGQLVQSNLKIEK